MNETTEKCRSCGVAQESDQGVIDFVNGYCEDCHDRRERGRIDADDAARSGDHDFSMNY